MSAQRLRDAAKVLRERAEDATPGPWEAGEACVWTDADLPSGVVVSDGSDGDGGAWDEADATYIALMHPGVALALADWLDSEANTCDATNYYRHPHLSGGLKRSPHLDAARIADEILGAES